MTKKKTTMTEAAGAAEAVRFAAGEFDEAADLWRKAFAASDTGDAGVRTELTAGAGCAAMIVLTAAAGLVAPFVEPDEADEIERLQTAAALEQPTVAVQIGGGATHGDLQRLLNDEIRRIWGTDPSSAEDRLTVEALRAARVLIQVAEAAERRRLRRASEGGGGGA